MREQCIKAQVVVCLWARAGAAGTSQRAVEPTSFVGCLHYLRPSAKPQPADSFERINNFSSSSSLLLPALPANTRPSRNEVRPAPTQMGNRWLELNRALAPRCGFCSVSSIERWRYAIATRWPPARITWQNTCLITCAPWSRQQVLARAV